MARFRGTMSAALLGIVVLIASPTVAQTPKDGEEQPVEEEPVDEATKKGREAYLRGLALANKEQWGDALASFEEAAVHRDAALVQYNIAYCLRALGRYVEARRKVKVLLAQPDGLSKSHLEDLNAHAAEFDSVVARVQITLVPQHAALTIDGRPLEKSGEDYVLASTAGQAASSASKTFTVLLDPGSHLFLARRKGHQDVVVQKSYRPGQKATLSLRLDEMPATVVVKSQPEDAIVRVDEREVGVAPTEFERPAGKYRVEVFKDDYETYTAELDLQAGQRAELTAELLPYVAPVYERWWFWTSLVGAVATGVVTAVVLTLPDPVPPDYDGGSTGWVVDPQPAGFELLRF